MKMGKRKSEGRGRVREEGEYGRKGGVFEG